MSQKTAVGIIENQSSFNLESMKLYTGCPWQWGLQVSHLWGEAGLGPCLAQLVPVAPAGLKRPTPGHRQDPHPGCWWLCGNMLLRNQTFINKSKIHYKQCFKNCLISNSWASNQEYVLLLTCCPILELSTKSYSSDDLREPRLYKTRSVTCWMFSLNCLRKLVTPETLVSLVIFPSTVAFFWRN